MAAASTVLGAYHPHPCQMQGGQAAGEGVGVGFTEIPEGGHGALTKCGLTCQEWGWGSGV